jgi:hypothetical protein
MDKKILLYPVFALFCVLYFVGIPSFVLEKLDDKYDFDIEGYHWYLSVLAWMSINFTTLYFVLD